MLLTLAELIDIALMVAIVGFLFRDILRAPPHQGHDDIVARYRKPKGRWDDFWWACALIAPGIILHELGHKFTAMSFGHAATFHAACSVSTIGTGGFFTFPCMMQAVVIAFKFIGIPFIFFIPGYVSFSGAVAPMQGVLIAFAGPLVHLAFWGACTWWLSGKRRARRLTPRRRLFLAFTARINLFLFVFNILPIPGFDGFQALRYLLGGLF